MEDKIMIAKLENGSIQIFDYDAYKKRQDQYYERMKVENSIQDSVINAILKKKEDKRSPEELLKIVLRKQLDDEYSKNINAYSDWLPFKEEEFNGTVRENYYKRPKFREEDGYIIESYEEVVDVSAVKQKIKTKQDELSSTDYMIIKTYEAKIAGSDEPYDNMTEIINQRKILRDEINMLQKLIDNI